MDLLNSQNFKVAITQLCNVQQVWNFTYYVIAYQKLDE